MKPGSGQRFAACLAALADDTPLPPERAAAALRELERAPYRKGRQGELPL